MNRVLKFKTCKWCEVEFSPFNSMQKCCAPKCALLFTRAEHGKKESKAERSELKRRKEKLMTMSDHMRLTQAVVNRYVLAKNKDMPCICCGKSPYSGVRHAGHFKSRGANSFLTFNLWNIWPCCYSCNVEKGGNIHCYREGLVKRIGLEKLDYLDNAPRSRIYEIEYLKRMRKIFNKKIKIIDKLRAKRH